MLPMVASASDNIRLDLNNYTLTISGEGSLKYIPSELYSEFRSSAYREVIFEDGITEIGEIFPHQIHLEKITLPKTLKKLGIYTFRGCTNLREVVFPDAEIEVLGGTFESCTNLKEIYIPESVTLSGYQPLGFTTYNESGIIEDLTIYTSENSNAYQYAKENNINVVIATREEYMAMRKTDEFYNRVSDWAKAEVEKAKEDDLIPYEMLEEDLTENMTRAEAAAIAVKLVEAAIGEDNDVLVKVNTDVEVESDYKGHIYSKYIDTAYYNNIVKGKSHDDRLHGIISGCFFPSGYVYYGPNSSVSREDFATILMRAINKINEAPDTFVGYPANKDTKYDKEYLERFEDYDLIAEYAREAIYYLYDHEIMKGTDDTHLSPTKRITREQGILLSKRILSLVMTMLVD